MGNKIELVKNGKCENCPCFKVDIIDEYYHNGDMRLVKTQTIVCKNEALCNHIEKCLIRKMSVE